MMEVVPFPAVTTFCPALSIAVSDSKVANGAKTILAKGAASFINVLANLPNKATKYFYFIILDSCGLVSFILVDIFLVKAFLVLVFCLVRSNL